MRRKVQVEDLAIGMYVAELDKPWEQSSFLFQGFEIESEEDLAKLRAECRFVVIDEAEVARRVAAKPGTMRPAAPAGPVTTITSRFSPELAGFKHEIREMLQAQTVARANITRVMEDVRMGKSLDTEKTKTAVTQMVSVISVNPNSMLWLTNLREKHERTAGHCLNTAILSIAFGKHIGLSNEELNILGQGAMLHDIGKVRVPPAVLDKAGPLAEEERQLVRKHPVDGEAVLRLTRQLPEEVLAIVRCHHERLDGRGYPDGLSGDAIPVNARIVGIVDTYDSLTSDAPYRQASTPADALRVLRTESGAAYGKDLIQEFIRCLGIYPIGSLVECNNGALAVVVSSNQASRLKPVIMVVRDEHGKEIKPRMLMSLATMGEELANRWGIKGTADPKKYDLNLPGIIAEEAGA